MIFSLRRGERMGLVDSITDIVKVVQQIDNIDLYQKIIGISAQAQELQTSLDNLNEENRELKRRKELFEKIIRHEEGYITLKDDKQEIMYCSRCWDVVDRLVQGHCNAIGQMHCPECKTKVIIDRLKYNNRPRQKIYWG